MDERLRFVGRFLHKLTLGLIKHDIATLSAQICFYALFSLFPLLILVIYGSSLLVPHSQIESIIVTFLKPYYPDIKDANKLVTQSIATLGSVGARLGLVSFVTLIWSATSAFIAVQQAMDTIFEIHDGRSFITRRIIGFVMMILLIIVAVLSSTALAFYPVLANRVSWWSVVSDWAPLVHRLTRILYPLSLFITCCLVYRFLPSRRIHFNSVVIGALTSTVALDLARTLFVVYAGHLVSYHLIYGGLTVVMVLVLWMYIAGILLLFGAEIAACLDSLGDKLQKVS